MRSCRYICFATIAFATVAALACSSEDDDATAATSGSASGSGAQSDGGGGAGATGATGAGAQGGAGGTSGGGGSAGGNAGSGGSSGGGSGGEGGNAAVTGCATPDGTKCPGLQQCCSGIPYPPEGICQDECNMKSDRFSKTAFESVDPGAILDAVCALEISEWSYLEEDSAVRHIGPMAQDFRRAFGLGSSDERIHPVDANGVAIAAIQELEQRLRRVSAANEQLQEDNEALAARLDRLEKRVR